MAYLLNVAVAEPQYRHSQASIMERMLEEPGLDAKTRKLIKAVYRGSAIQERHSVLPDFTPGLPPALFFGNSEPNVDDRLAVYYREATGLAVRACRTALEDAGMETSQVTHLIVCSCTGLQAPGVDVEVAKELNLCPETERLGLYFIGCHAALKALRMARHIARSEPDAVILIVAVELCSIHMTPNHDADSVMANALFSDGAAACIVTAQRPEKGGFRIEQAFSRIIPQTSEAEMAWSISSSGFLMRLSSYIPEVLSERFLPGLMANLRTLNLVPDGDLDWLIHPGGRRILDALAKEINLPQPALKPSYNVLERYGNMSSPTILYVLKEYLESPERKPGKLSLLLGFGPGLTAEAVILSS